MTLPTKTGVSIGHELKQWTLIFGKSLNINGVIVLSTQAMHYYIAHTFCALIDLPKNWVISTKQA